MCKRRPVIILLALTISFSLFSPHQILKGQSLRQRYLPDVWSTEKGLPQNSVTSLVQTRDGYLWVGTFGGLARFDGLQFTVFDTGNAPGLKSNRITALFEDHAGVLWIGTEQNGLSRYENGKFTTFSTAEGLRGNYVKSIGEDVKGGLWTATSDGLARLVDGRFTNYSTRDGLADNQVVLVSAGRDDTMWFVSANGLTRWQEGRVSSYLLPENISFSTARSLLEGPDGSVWIAGLRVFARFREGNFTFYYGPESAQGPERVSVFRGRSGQLRFLMSSNVPSLTGEDVIADPGMTGWAGAKSIIEDREGNLWVGSGSEGLYRYKAPQVTAYTAENGLTDDSVLVITGDGAGGLWLGSHNLFHFRDGGFEKDARWVGVPGSTTGFWALLRDRDGTVWAGTYGALHHFKDGRWTVFPKNVYGVNGDPIAAIYEDRGGNLWVGTGRADDLGGLYRFKDGVFIPYGTSAGLTLTDVRLITEDRHGALWLGGASGMSRYQDNIFTNYTTEQGLSNNYVRDIYEDADGTLWVGTYGGGLNRFKDGRFTAITTKDGLFDNIVSRILEDDNGNLWMSCNRGIFRASRKDLNDLAERRLKTITCVSYGVADGMKSSETNGGCQPAGWKDREGKLWFPTIKGVVMIDPHQLNHTPQPVVIEGVLVDKAAVDFGQMITMRPGQSDLEIQYTSPSLTAPEKVRFKYKLEGYDRDWVDAKERRVAYYTHVAPGTYKFRVIAANNDGFWSTQDAIFELTVIPPFWRTWWFTIWVLLVLSGGVVFFNQRRIRKLERARQVQEEFSKQLIASQEGERKRLAGELHDSLSQNLVVIKNRAWLSLQEPDNHESVLEQMEEIADAADQSLAEVREIAYNLRPFQIDRLGLTAAVESLVTRVDTPELRFAAQLDNIDALLPPDMEINLYRIVQEGINNIIKHSAASQASIRFKRGQDLIEVAIEDNGRGFDLHLLQSLEPGDGHGFGLIGITERARILGSVPEIHSAPGQGTRILIKLPCRHTRSASKNEF